MKLIERIADFVVAPIARAYRVAFRREMDFALHDAKKRLHDSSSHDYVLAAMKLMITEEVGRAIVGKKTINLQDAHAHYVDMYAKHAKYGPDRPPAVGVETGALTSRSYDFATGLNGTQKGRSE